MKTDPPPALASRIVRQLLVWYYQLRGWKAEGAPPADRRCIIVAAPHTSNWDFVNVLGLTNALGIKAHFMGKSSLFRWPMGRFMRDMGGVAVDRSASRNYVDAMIAEFAARREFMLIIAPEGTRSAAGQWRTGFYHIAMGAGVPLVLGYVDYPSKTGGLGPEIMPSGDYAADMAKIVAFYATKTGRHPDRAVTDFATIIGKTAE
ncbi:lysophospholipid acyltransferase family protein [Sphingomonas sp. AOB5]|uniref:lysophospholipid acyltransferase family protein n=1 Tax=Sphingomonas sp. AOB5 TaxID=3034017 RepID=UPI0023F88DA4|nr:lysophospholipid acyltransferase family protein [Sphingomonas sp. AOB5]MDF7776822.1 lysophospholipid acyltransferase family protein [Sphingomonas sp. AOB5]